MAASIYVGNRHISTAVNVLKSHPDHLIHYPEWCVSIHAEHNAILKARASVEGGTIYVIRYNGITSKPCDGCMELIRRNGIDKVVYLNNEKLVKEYV